MPPNVFRYADVVLNDALNTQEIKTPVMPGIQLTISLTKYGTSLSAIRTVCALTTIVKDIKHAYRNVIKITLTPTLYGSQS